MTSPTPLVHVHGAVRLVNQSNDLQLAVCEMWMSHNHNFTTYIHACITLYVLRIVFYSTAYTRNIIGELLAFYMISVVLEFGSE